MAAVSKKRTTVELPATVASVTAFPKLGAFAAEAFKAHAAGLYVIPVTRDDKKPLIEKPFRASRQRHSTLQKWATTRRFAGANYGLVCWSSNIIVVDCDTPNENGRVPPIVHTAAEVRDLMVKTLGPPAVVVRTGRAGGGWHLYYRAPRGVTVNGMCLKRYGIAAQIKAGKAFVMGPGSIHPKTGDAYVFETGGWDDFASLTVFPVERLQEITGPAEESKRSKRSAPSTPREEGDRNPNHFKDLCTATCDGEFLTNEAIIERARHWNVTRNVVPEEDYKVVATANSVWQLYQEGRLRRPGRAVPALPGNHWDRLRTLGKNYGNAFLLYMELKSAHPKGGEFPISAGAMAKSERVPGKKDKKWYTATKDDLLAAGVIERVSWAKHLEGRAALYRFTPEGAS